MTEIPFDPGWLTEVAPGITGVAFGPDPVNGHIGPGPRTYVLVIPPRVTSMSVWAAGAGMNGYTGFGSVVAPPVAYRFIRRVPVTPGDEWLLEPGGGPTYVSPVAASYDSRWRAGDGGDGHAFGWGYGIAGGGASGIGRRGGGPGGDWLAVAAGRGGVSSNRVPAGWEGTYGTPADQTAGEHWSDDTDRFYTWDTAPPMDLTRPPRPALLAAGGGGGGWIAGAPGAAWMPGENGWSRWPPSSDLGAGRSPSAAEVGIDTDDPFPPIGGRDYNGVVGIYWYTPSSGGWSVGIGW